MPPAQAKAIADDYGDAQLQGLKRAIGAVGIFALLSRGRRIFACSVRPIRSRAPPCGSPSCWRAQSAIVLVFFAVDTLRNEPEAFSAIVVIVAMSVGLDLVWKRIRGDAVPYERS